VTDHVSVLALIRLLIGFQLLVKKIPMHAECASGVFVGHPREALKTFTLTNKDPPFPIF
jgi:hypothetical protein